MVRTTDWAKRVGVGVTAGVAKANGRRVELMEELGPLGYRDEQEFWGSRS
jgi:hypothetical protein